MLAVRDELVGCFGQSCEGHPLDHHAPGRASHIDLHFRIVGAPGSGAGSSPGDMVEQICTVDAVIVDKSTCSTVRGELDAMVAPDVKAAIYSAAVDNVEPELQELTFI